MGYCLKIIKKDGDVVKHYFSSYDELDYNATLCQFSTNIVKAIGMKIGLFKNKTLFEKTNLHSNCLNNVGRKLE